MCCMYRQQQLNCASLVRWEAQHSGVLQEVVTIPSSDQLSNAVLWLLVLSSNPLVSILTILPQGDGTLHENLWRI